MKKAALLVMVLVWGLLGRGEVWAKSKTPSPTMTPTLMPSPTVVEVKKNITEVSGKTVSKVAEVKWQGWNSSSYLIAKAVKMGVPENTIVLLLLLPLVASLVSVIHYVGGLSGYGIFTPTMIAVALLATGIPAGLTLFGIILAITLLSNLLLKKMKLHYWPARSITLLFVGVGTFCLMTVAAYLKLFEVSKISIFPILFMILLTEDFVRTQLTKSKKEAVKLTIGTLILSVAGALAMGIGSIQEVVLKYSEAVILLVVVVNIIVGSYGGIRLTEIRRFKGAIRKK